MLFISLGWLLLSRPAPQLSKAPSSAVPPPSEKDIQYQSYIQEDSIVHVLLIPAGKRFSVTPALSQPLNSLERIAQLYPVVAILNGGFFDPQNQKSTSYVIQQGQLVADPRLNERLMRNPKLAPYLNKILDRTEFRRYRCGQTIRYDIARHSEPTPTGCSLLDALGGGPRLLPEITSLQEGFVDISQGKIIRDALGSRQPNARSAVGITDEGNVVLVMVAQKSADANSAGMSFESLAAFMKTLGVEQAMNLDGGSSSSLYYKGKTIYGKVDAKGTPLKRPVLSVLLVQENKP